MRGTFTIEPLDRAQIDEAGDVLGEAFSENPVARAALSHCDPSERLSRVSRLNRALVGMGQRFGVVDVVRSSGRVLGVSIHFPSGAWPVGARGIFYEARAGLAVGLRGAYRYLRYEMAVGPLHYAEPHAYLFVLGVLPEFQGRGVGSALLRAFCERADAEGLPCYLETDKESSVRLYRSHGFGIEREIDIAPLDGLHTWLMLRGPARHG